MKAYVVYLLASAVTFSSCEKKAEVVTVTETRTATTRDTSPKLFATSDERFRDAKPSPVKAETPQGWRQLPASQFRILNYRFGETGMGEVWVSLSAGSVLDNVNRWLKQFSAGPVDLATLEKLPTAKIADTTGTFVTASGDYEGGMGAAIKPGFALAGIVASLSDGSILTVKMVGPKAEVEAARPTLESFAQTLKMTE
jgi:hypothetical protein